MWQIPPIWHQGRANTNHKNYRQKLFGLDIWAPGGKRGKERWKIEEFSSLPRVSSSPSGAAEASLRHSASVCHVLICHPLKHNGEQMPWRWIANHNTHPHTRTHTKTHTDICSIHRTRSNYITLASLPVEHWQPGQVFLNQEMLRGDK